MPDSPIDGIVPDPADFADDGNADIAAARAQNALAHLAQYAGAGKALAFEARTGDPARAPYPNDSPKNRRLNRTVTVQVIPAP